MYLRIKPIFHLFHLDNYIIFFFPWDLSLAHHMYLKLIN